MCDKANGRWQHGTVFPILTVFASAANAGTAMAITMQDLSSEDNPEDDSEFGSHTRRLRLDDDHWFARYAGLSYINRRDLDSKFVNLY
jgi:hypothetical protein